MGDKNKSRGESASRKDESRMAKLGLLVEGKLFLFVSKAQLLDVNLNQDSIHFLSLDDRRMVKEGFLLFDLKNLPQFLEENVLFPTDFDFSRSLATELSGKPLKDINIRMISFI